MKVTSAVVVLCTSMLFASSAAAQESDSARGGPWTDEHMAVQFGVGMYRPDPGDPVFDTFYGGDNGPLINFGADFFVYRIPYVGPLGVGVSMGWASYKGEACAEGTAATGCGETTQQSKLNLFPVAATALLRIDVLARHTPVPLIFTGRVGFDSVFFIEKSGQKTQGRTHGVRWGFQVALELNSLARPRAAALDDDWGINSSFLFVELIGSNANSRAQLGDKLAWTAGLGLTF